MKQSSFARQAVIASLRGELRDLRADLTDGEAGLLAEVLRLRGLLRVMLDCTDRQCGLCASCIRAVQQIEPERAGPIVAEDDPIRQVRGKQVAA